MILKINILKILKKSFIVKWRYCSRDITVCVAKKVYAVVFFAIFQNFQNHFGDLVFQFSWFL